MLKHPVPKFRPDIIFARLRDIAKKQVPVKLKQIVVAQRLPHPSRSFSASSAIVDKYYIQ